MLSWGRWVIGWCPQKPAYIPARARETNWGGLRAPARGNRPRALPLPDSPVQDENSPVFLEGWAVRLSRPMAAELPWRRRRLCEEPRGQELRQRWQKRSHAGSPQL